ncbi:MAG: FtsX-like permease family protein [Bacteroidales bacterium]|nr:FtsX-like permease family protein [Bacteroidales bacterium]
MKSFIKFLSRHKLYTTIEAIGLTVSLAFVILIGSYVVQQYEVAHEAPDWERTFVLGTDEFFGLSYWDKEEVEANIPEVEVITHVNWLWDAKVEIDNEKPRCSGMATDAAFFDVFPEYHLVEGDVKSFVSKTDVLVSQSFARRIAKDGESVVGNVLKVNDTEKTIKGVFADFDHQFFLDVDILTHVSDTWGASMPKSFSSIGGYATWYRLLPNADIEQAEAKVKALLHKNYDQNWSAARVDKWRPFRIDEAFFSGNDTLTTRNGDLKMLQLLTVVVLLLLLSAIFNYVNLSLALTGKRAKEMATRRLLGAQRSSILLKYIVESVSFTAVCFGAALVLAKLFVPMMNELLSNSDPEMVAWGMAETSVRLSFMLTPNYIGAYVACIIFIGTICGLLPAFTASRCKPIDVIKGTLRLQNKLVLNRIFIVIQNVLTVFLIAMALVMEAQMNHMLSRPMHIKTDNLYYIEYIARDVDMAKLLKDKLEQLPFVKRVGVSQGMPCQINMAMGITLADETDVELPVIICDTTYFDMMGFDVKEDFGTPKPHSIWLCESAYNTIVVNDTINSGKIFNGHTTFNGVTTEFIGGVVANFPSRPASDGDLHPNSAVIIGNSEEMKYANYMLIETTSEDEAFAQQIQNIYKECRQEITGVPESAFDYGYLRDLDYKLLEPVRRTMRLVELFAVLSVIISLLGLLAMSTYFAGENTKQIAIRKVFGSDVHNEIFRNIRDYMVMVVIACVVGIPLAVWAARVYLERFAYRTENYAWVFFTAVGISIAIAFVTVLWQTAKAAKTNPAEELKKE